MSSNIAIFALKTVFFPNSILPLRIFEARYLDMISNCLRKGEGFGICLIEQGSEIGKAAKPCQHGTYARIIDWQQNPDGLLGIVVQGEQRFRILSSSVAANHLVLADVEWVTDEPSVPVGKEFSLLRDLLTQLIEQLDLPYTAELDEMNDAAWLGYRLAELFPFELKLKQQMLEINDSNERLEIQLGLINEAVDPDQLH